MRFQATSVWQRVWLSLGIGVLSVALWGAPTWASTRIGDMELQMWYSTRNTFHTDGGKHFDWVQWRNEVAVWLTYENAVKNGKVFGQYDIPLVESAALNARYRFRADPAWELKKSFSDKYDGHERKSYLFPENGFRDLFADLNFGQVGPGTLGLRVGYQQIVWGESDLFRSIDVINPLRIDQNQGAGEKFDEFRSPILAFKGLYNIGNVGSLFSNVFIEPFFTPGFRGPNSDLILNGLQLRSPIHMKGCYDQNNNLIPYSASDCSGASTLKTIDGVPRHVFQPWDPSYIGRRRTLQPWAFIAREPNPRSGSPDFANNSDSPDIANTRVTYIPEVYKGLNKGPLNGMWNTHTMAGGFRIFGSSVGGFDFSLNYAYIPQGVQGTFDIKQVGAAKVYGDPATAAALGINPATLAGTFQEGLDRCLNAKGIAANPRNSGSQKRKAPKSDATVLIGADLAGYDDPGRFGSNGALNPDGTVKPGKHGAIRRPETDCFPASYNWNWTNVIGFTSTYNDFDYTGAVFRLEESISTKEYVRHDTLGAAFTGNSILAANLPPDQAAALTARNLRYSPKTIADLGSFMANKNYHNYSPVWRSMLGFDLFKSMPWFKYIPGIHRSFYEQAWFLSGQWLMMNRIDNNANPLCYVVDNGGNGLTTEAVAALDAATGQKHYSNPRCRNYRWNHLFTLGFANQGLFGSHLETRNAVALEPRAQDFLLYSQWWWRNVLGYPSIELSWGVAWYPSSGMSQGWSGLYAFADRDQLWAEFKYYLL